MAAGGVSAVGFNQWWVPWSEFIAGAASLSGSWRHSRRLICLSSSSIATSGRQRIKFYKPIDKADRIDDWFYLPETLYAFMLIIVVSAGAGPYSLDAMILGLME
jgi:uncharacterized membrane protein YphA (DoxX/SURF4 family)